MKRGPGTLVHQDPYTRIWNKTVVVADSGAGVEKMRSTVMRSNGGYNIMELLSVSFTPNIVGWDDLDYDGQCILSMSFPLVNGTAVTDTNFNKEAGSAGTLASYRDSTIVNRITFVGTGEAYASAALIQHKAPYVVDFTNGTGYGYLFAGPELTFAAWSHTTGALTNTSFMSLHWRPKWVSARDYMRIRSDQHPGH